MGCAERAWHPHHVLLARTGARSRAEGITLAAGDAFGAAILALLAQSRIGRRGRVVELALTFGVVLIGVITLTGTRAGLVPTLVAAAATLLTLSGATAGAMALAGERAVAPSSWRRFARNSLVSFALYPLGMAAGVAVGAMITGDVP
jgi:hypothetical protein